jgi:Tfp pilus assembly protein PilW
MIPVIKHIERETRFERATNKGKKRNKTESILHIHKVSWASVTGVSETMESMTSSNFGLNCTEHDKHSDAGSTVSDVSVQLL